MGNCCGLNGHHDDDSSTTLNRLRNEDRCESPQLGRWSRKSFTEKKSRSLSKPVVRKNSRASTKQKKKKKSASNVSPKITGAKNTKQAKGLVSKRTRKKSAAMTKSSSLRSTSKHSKTGASLYRSKTKSLPRNMYSRKSSNANRTMALTCDQSICCKEVDSMYGSGVKFVCSEYKKIGRDSRETLAFCGPQHTPRCARCSAVLGKETKKAFVKKISSVTSAKRSSLANCWASIDFYCSEQCYDFSHTNRTTLVRGATTDDIAGSAEREMKSTAFENDFEETMRKIAPLLGATMSSPTCRFCRCEFKPKDEIQMVGALKAHTDCAARGAACYSATRKKPKEKPMSPRVVAGFYLHEIKKSMKECKKRFPEKDPQKFAEKYYQYHFDIEFQGKKVQLYLFVDVEDAQRSIDSAEGMNAVILKFYVIDETGRKKLKKKLKRSAFESSFLVRHEGVKSADEGRRFVQDTSKAHVTAAKGCDESSKFEFSVLLLRSNAGVEQHFRIRFSYNPPSGRLRALSASLDHHQAA